MARPSKEESFEDEDELDEDFDDFDEDEEDDSWDEEDDEETEEDEDDEDGEDDADEIDEKLVEQIKSQTVKTIVEAIASGDSDNEVYKGLQRVISQKDKKITELENALTRVADKFEADDENREERDEVLTFLLENYVELIGEDEAKVKLGGLQAKVQERRIKKLEERQNKPQRQQTSNDTVDPQLETYKKQALETLREYATDMGVDPDDKTLDYGVFEDGVVGRMSKLKASIKKVKAESDDTKSVTAKKKKRPVTRTSSPSVPKATGGSRSGSRFDKGVDEQFKRMLKLSKG